MVRSGQIVDAAANLCGSNGGGVGRCAAMDQRGEDSAGGRLNQPDWMVRLDRQLLAPERVDDLLDLALEVRHGDDAAVVEDALGLPGAGDVG